MVCHGMSWCVLVFHGESLGSCHHPHVHAHYENVQRTILIHLTMFMSTLSNMSMSGASSYQPHHVHDLHINIQRTIPANLQLVYLPG